jgi:DNA-binding MarR family transcriptional regulator
MSKYPSAVPVLQKWEEFLQLHPEGSLETFGAWLQHNATPMPAVSADAARLSVYLERERFVQAAPHDPRTDQYAGYLIGRLYKFVRFYMKPHLQEAGLNSVEEFGFLASMQELKESNKKDLIAANMVEPTTGLDIIKRLVKNEWLREKTHPQDGRAKLLIITDKGKKVLQQLFISFGQLPEILPDLDPQQKETLLSILEHLDRHHSSTFEKYR